MSKPKQTRTDTDLNLPKPPDGYYFDISKPKDGVIYLSLVKRRPHFLIWDQLIEDKRIFTSYATTYELEYQAHKLLANSQIEFNYAGKYYYDN